MRALDSPRERLASPRIGRRRILRFAVIVLVALLLLAGVERAGRLFPGLMPPQWQLLHSAIEKQARLRVVPDEEIGFLLPPGRDTDSRGFPNEDPWPVHATFVFLGDSFLTGEGVGRAGNFTHLIAHMIPDKPVVNLGLPAAGVERQLLLYRRFGVALQPRIVMACLYLATDFDNDAIFRNWVREGHGTEFVNFRSAGDKGAYEDSLTLLETFQLGRLLEKSWLYGKAKELTVGWIWGRDRIEDRYRFPDGTDTLLARHQLDFATSPVNPNDPRIEALVASLERMRDFVTGHGATLLVVLIPSKEELVRVSASAERVNALARTRDRLQAARFEVLDLYPAIRAGMALQTPYISEDIHLNAYGNRIVAEEFVSWFNRHAHDEETHATAGQGPKSGRPTGY